MKKDKLYLLTFLAILSVVYFVGYFSTDYLVDISTEQFLKIQISSSKREAKEMASLVSYQIKNGVAKETIKDNIQKSIENTDLETGFICMFDWSGKEICHPNPSKIGKITGPDESYVSGVQDDIGSKDFYSYLKNKKEGGGIRDFTDKSRDSEIIYLYPVKNSDWIIAAHANLDKINSEIENLKTNFILVYLATGALIVFLLLFLIRLIGSKYEKQLELKNEVLSTEVLNLSKLNNDLASYKEKVIQAKNTAVESEVAPHKNRILTHYRNELVPISVNEIAYIFMENGVTYIKTIEGKICTSNDSLEELFKNLNETLFFRANRQYILSINAIDKIYKYGNKQLKIIVLPKSKVDIIISKHKASAFKNWLNS
ncbi:LytTR family transcriptional regulator DNA-binding domain-containing protein [Tenacibaculum sp. nBUS_03]|uniref:LytTR family transcriptional regulator DNA-binding domain-containing protein n=1 Tax=Tenacibaculum sp. nBUS_03 TaxID=3395320 RepID=UPI003EB7BE1B